MTFKDGAATIGSGAVGAGGVVSINTGTLAVTSHNLTAVYSGDTNVATSTSAILAQVVAKDASTTVVTADVNPTVIARMSLLPPRSARMRRASARQRDWSPSRMERRRLALLP